MTGRRIVVTGGAGFIGRHVVAALVELGDEVVVVDCHAHPAVETVVGDIATPGVLERAVGAGADGVVHLAAVTSVLGSLERPMETFRTNVAGTAELLECARLRQVPVVVMASTNAVVGAGAPPGDARLDETARLAPLTPYGATKAAAEMLLSSSTAAYGVRGVSLRLTNVYGTGMVEKDSIVARIMRAAVSGSTMDVYGDGRQVRDYVFAHDVTSAVLLALADDRLDGPLVIGSGRSTSVLDLLALAREVTGCEIPARHVAPKPGEMPGVRVDTARARSFGWSATVDLSEGLRRVWEAWV